VSRDRSPARRGTRSIGSELKLLFRAISFFAILLLVVNIGSRVVVLSELRPHARALQTVQDDLNDLNAGMLNEETGLRGYLASGSNTFLEPYLEAKPEVDAALARVMNGISNGQASRDFISMQRAQLRWSDEWAKLAVSPQYGSLTGAATASRPPQAELAQFLSGGKVLFDGYRTAFTVLSDDIQSSLTAADDAESAWLVWSGILQALIALGAVSMAFVASRRLRRLVVEPVAALVTTVAQLRSGHLDARVPKTKAPTELVALSHDVDEMAVTLQDNSDLAEQRAREIDRHVDRLGLVLGVAREIAGSLSLRYVLEAVTEAALRIGSVRARVWLVDQDERSIATEYDTAGDRKSPVEVLRLEIGVGSVGRAVQYGRPIGPEPAEVAGETLLAVPMIIGGRVVGVLECIQRVQDAPPEGDVRDVLAILEALAAQAAGSVESARLHEKTAEMAVTDALTGLQNRRAFDNDLAAEVRRALRYGRPLSVIFLDLDHFKAVNDRYGHDYGDIALQQAATALRANMRDTDRCYRLGGEELIVIAPETNVREALMAAERLRKAIEHSAGPGAPVVTASFGVAELPTHAANGGALVRAADLAVYAAKSRGRNCVAVAGPEGPPGAPGQQGPWVPMPR
jgi:diguanylate cyclase (GGDEF)-like protein